VILVKTETVRMSFNGKGTDDEEEIRSDIVEYYTQREIRRFGKTVILPLLSRKPEED
jgi:hypothetical protein